MRLPYRRIRESPLIKKKASCLQNDFALKNLQKKNSGGNINYGTRRREEHCDKFWRQLNTQHDTFGVAKLRNNDLSHSNSLVVTFGHFQVTLWCPFYPRNNGWAAIQMFHCLSLLPFRCVPLSNGGNEIKETGEKKKCWGYMWSEGQKCRTFGALFATE